jgi:hypothetical protein
MRSGSMLTTSPCLHGHRDAAVDATAREASDMPARSLSESVIVIRGELITGETTLCLLEEVPLPRHPVGLFPTDIPTYPLIW